MKFPPTCRVNLQGHIFFKGGQPLTVFAFLQHLMMEYFLEILEIKIFFTAQSWWPDFYLI